MGRLIDEGLLALGDIDPLGRHLNHYNREPRVQICLVAEDRQLQDRLLKYGISTQTPQEIEPVHLRPASALQEVYGWFSALSQAPYYTVIRAIMIYHNRATGREP